jgi:DNA-binding CsgD family transcriptional regulator/tetratricopeptide (TPR) repeat protein
MARMTGPYASARYVGRAAEFARLAMVLDEATAGRPATLLLAADAGLGATRFLDEAARRLELASTPMTVVRCPAGTTVDGRAYGPIVGGLEPHLVELDDDALIEVVGPNGGELVRLIPGLRSRLEVLGLLPARLLVSDLERRQSRLLEGLFGVLTRLAEIAPIVVMLDDLHRADPATRSFAEFVSRVSRGQRIAVVAAYQPDALDREHPFHATLAVMHGSPRPPATLELGPLDRDELASVIADIEGERPSASVLLLVAERSAGSPLVAEELLAARRELSGVSLTGSLEDLIRARLADRSPECRRLLRFVAPAGRPISATEIATVGEAYEAGRLRRPPRSTTTPRAADGPLDPDLAAGLAEAIDHGFLVELAAPAGVDDPGPWFAIRHELVARAIAGDLLPHQRPRLQAALAVSAQDRPAVAVRHWLAAGRPDEARPAAIAAAEASEAIDAPDQALAFLETSLELTVPGGDGHDDASLPDLLARAARAAFAAGRPDRAVAFAEAAAAGLDEARDRLDLAMLLARLGRYRWTAGDRDGAVETLRRAVRLVPQDAGRERARVLAALAQIRMLDGQFEEAKTLAAEALDVAGAVGETALGEAAHALTTLGVSEGWGEDPEAGIRHLEEARETASRAGRLDEVFRAYANLSTVLDLQGDREAAVEVAMEGIAAAREVGQEAVYGNWLRGNAADTLFLLGRWDEARALARVSLEWSPAGFGWTNSAINLATIEVESTAGETAGRLLGQLLVDLETVPDPQYAPPVYQAAASFALWRDDVIDARRAAQLGWERARGTEDWALIARVAATVLEVTAADLADARRRRDLAAIAAARSLADEVLREATDAVAASGVDTDRGSRREADARLMACRAFRARLDGRDDPSAWASVAMALEAVGDVYQAARARWRQAEAALTADDDARVARTAARGPLIQAMTSAAELGALPLLRELQDLASRALIRLPETLAASVETALAGTVASVAVAGEPVAVPIGPAAATVGAAAATGSPALARTLVGEADAQPADTFGLSPREREVLGLLAEGRTNREIGDRLFISQKTVGVHVGNILTKLGVSGRVEAATVAIRLGLTRSA